ncbi:MAG: ABC transporter substrate-binding protein, partial [Xanthomonadales bacterium]|nr:ABC transporter substrate-binding protein [Xanthomonadales bacterium]NIV33749.1 ABC transporter substrate-binding protein [Anaerolineae bacterium]NIX13698.1 ABC transporter substrate-binding protein [Xanthomonadales bacterium]
MRGGTYTASMQLQLLDHPARLSWVEGANIVRQFGEYLTETGPDNITRPYLLDRWEASDDVLTWDLYLKQGIKWN